MKTIEVIEHIHTFLHSSGFEPLGAGKKDGRINGQKRRVITLVYQNPSGYRGQTIDENVVNSSDPVSKFRRQLMADNPHLFINHVVEFHHEGSSQLVTKLDIANDNDPGLKSFTVKDVTKIIRLPEELL